MSCWVAEVEVRRPASRGVRAGDDDIAINLSMEIAPLSASSRSNVARRGALCVVDDKQGDEELTFEQIQLSWRWRSSTWLRTRGLLLLSVAERCPRLPSHRKGNTALHFERRLFPPWHLNLAVSQHQLIYDMILSGCLTQVEMADVAHCSERMIRNMI